MSGHGHAHAHGPANRGERHHGSSAPLFVRPVDGLARTAVVVCHDEFGLTQTVEQLCRAVASRGHLAVAPYFYYDTGGREFRTRSVRAAEQAWSRLSKEALHDDILGAVDYTQKHHDIPVREVVILGLGATGEPAARAALQAGAASETATTPENPRAAAGLIQRVDAGLRRLQRVE